MIRRLHSGLGISAEVLIGGQRRRLRHSPLKPLDSLHRHALGEVARLVHVAAAGDGGVIGEQLQRYHAQQRLERLQRRGNVDHMV